MFNAILLTVAAVGLAALLAIVAVCFGGSPKWEDLKKIEKKHEVEFTLFPLWGLFCLLVLVLCVSFAASLFFSTSSVATNYSSHMMLLVQLEAAYLVAVLVWMALIPCREIKAQIKSRN